MKHKARIAITKQTIYGPDGICIDLDPGQCFTYDPGAGEPMVIRHGKSASTFSCARDNRWRLGISEEYRPTREQVRWLDGLHEALLSWNWRAWSKARAAALAKKARTSR